jgi:hypothetical protein
LLFGPENLSTPKRKKSPAGISVRSSGSATIAAGQPHASKSSEGEIPYNKTTRQKIAELTNQPTREKP